MITLVESWAESQTGDRQENRTEWEEAEHGIEESDEHYILKKEKDIYTDGVCSTTQYRGVVSLDKLHGDNIMYYDFLFKFDNRSMRDHY